MENIHLYYYFITVAAIGDAHSIKIILNVSLKTANRHFVLYKILALPTRIFNDIFLQYLPEFLFFGIDTVQHKYVFFMETELSHCAQSSITVQSLCPEQHYITVTVPRAALQYSHCAHSSITVQSLCPQQHYGTVSVPTAALQYSHCAHSSIIVESLCPEQH